MNNLSVVKVRAPCKRKATESITERPAKLIRTAVQEEDDDGDSEITVNDVKTVVLLSADNVERSAGHYRKHDNKPLTCLDICLSARIREKTC